MKGFNQLLAHQAFWNDAQRQIYTGIMARRYSKSNHWNDWSCPCRWESLFKAPKFQRFYSEYPEYKNSKIVAKCMSWNGIQTYNNVKELLPHPTAFILGPFNFKNRNVPMFKISKIWYHYRIQRYRLTREQGLDRSNKFIFHDFFIWENRKLGSLSENVT